MRRIRSANFTLPGVLALIEILDFLDFTADGKSAFLKVVRLEYTGPQS